MSYLLLIFFKGLESFSITIDNKPHCKWFVPVAMYLIPLALGALCVILNLEFTDKGSVCLTSISIISAIVFGMLFVVPEQIKGLIDREEKSKNTHKDANIALLRNFIRITIQRMSFFVVVAIILIISLISLEYVEAPISYWFTGVTACFGYWYICTLLSLVVNAHVVNINIAV